MRLTNRLGLPAGIVAAVANDPYNAGPSDISVTKLITSPYQRQLLRKHSEDLEEDVSQRIWSLLGQSVHTILERAYPAGRGIAEERLYTQVNDWTVSGQMDVLEDGILSDFKVTSVWSYIMGGKEEWTQQLNLLKVLCDQRLEETEDERYRVEKLQIVAIFRDWQESKVGNEYPESQVAVIPVELWPKDVAMDFLRERVASHQNQDPDPCTNEERWYRGEQWALMKEGRKTAVRLFDAQDKATEAEKEAKEKDKKSKFFVIHRPGSYARCERYCLAAKHCPTWQAHLKDTMF